MTSLEHKRHTLAHLLAQAILEQHPDAKLTLGPAVDNGFYYDVAFGTTKVSDADLSKLEEAMRKNLADWPTFSAEEVSKEGALERFAGNPFKAELIEEIAARGEKITLYTCGAFTDLCRGGHAENPASEITPDSFKLDRVAGAYWRGDETKPMLSSPVFTVLPSTLKKNSIPTSPSAKRRRSAIIVRSVKRWASLYSQNS
jgi:threonyl-tRNA synthetase